MSDGSAPVNAQLDRESQHVVPLWERLLLNVEETAALLGIGRNAVWELVRSGQLLTLRVGRHVHVTRASIDSFVERNAAPYQARDN
jgi:excisionase family DNA binding protein